MKTINAFNDVEAKAISSNPGFNLSSISYGQDFFGDMRVGNKGFGSLRIEGKNNRIIINDGTNDRILIGYQSGGF